MRDWSQWVCVGSVWYLGQGYEVMHGWLALEFRQKSEVVQLFICAVDRQFSNAEKSRGLLLQRDLFAFGEQEIAGLS